MGFLTDLIEKAKGFLEEAPPPTSTHAIRTNSFDRADWEKVRSIPMVADEVEAAARTIDYTEDLFQDLHGVFYKVEPDLRPASEMAETHQANRTVIETLQGFPEINNLRQHSVGDTYGTAMSVVSIKETVVSTVSEVAKAQAEAEAEAEEARKRAEEAAQQIQELIERGQQMGPLTEEEDNAIRCGLTAAIDAQQQAQQQQQQAQQQAQQAGQQAAQGLAQAIRSAAKKADEQLQEDRGLAQSFGVDPGVLQRMDVRERMELAKTLRNNRLASFAKLLGQFKTVQQAESRKRVTNAATEIHGITTSDEIGRMTPGELLNFADPSLETLMWLRWTERQLSTYDVRGKERMGQGPIVCVVDESASMGAPLAGLGTREAWSKALALALCDQARRRKRDFVYIGFASSGQQHTIRFPDGVSELSKVLEMTEHFFGGGTHYEKPLRTALEIIEKEYDSTAKGRPDIVFMSDDEYGALDTDFMAEWNRIKDKTSIKCYGIAIGFESSGALRQVSDNLRAITDMVADPREVGDLFRTI